MGATFSSFDGPMRKMFGAVKERIRTKGHESEAVIEREWLRFVNREKSKGMYKFLPLCLQYHHLFSVLVLAQVRKIKIITYSTRSSTQIDLSLPLRSLPYLHRQDDHHPNHRPPLPPCLPQVNPGLV